MQFVPFFITVFIITITTHVVDPSIKTVMANTPPTIAPMLIEFNFIIASESISE